MALSMFNLLEPANSASIAKDGDSLYFEWGSAGADVSQYTLEISTSSTFSTLFAIYTSFLSNYSVDKSSFSIGTTYYWRVRAQDSKGATRTASNAPFKFTVKAPSLPGSFSLISPANGVYINPSEAQGTITFTWGASQGATEYHLELYMNGTRIYQTYVFSTSKSVSRSFEAGEYYTYTWKVTAYNDAGSTTSNTHTFYYATPPLPPPGSFSLTSPVNGSAKNEVNPVLEWTSSTDAVDYLVQVSKVPTFNSFVYSGYTTNTSQKITNLEYNTTYYWRVTAINDAGQYQTSYFTFTTKQQAHGTEDFVYEF